MRTQGKSRRRWNRLNRTVRAVLEPIEQRVLMAGQISGSLWNDVNRNGARDVGEPALSEWTVYLDQNQNRKLDSGETSTTTSATGQYDFAGLTAGNYYVAQQVPAGWVQTFPGSDGIVAGEQSQPSGQQVTLTYTGSNAPANVLGEVVPGGGFSTQDAESNPLINLIAFRNDARFSSIDGKGYAVAVLDTGIDVNHPFFGADLDGNGVADRIVYQHDYVNGDNDATDGHGHGSNVSSIAAGQDSTHSGMAPGANIIAMKVLSDSGSGQFSYVEQALQWCVANAQTYNLVAINLSLGDSGNYNTSQQLYGISDELAALAAQNVIVVSAAGNGYYASQSQGVSYPAADPNSLRVGAVYDANVGSKSYSSGAVDYSSAADRLCSFSQRSTAMNVIFAPGAVITGANYNGGTIGYTGTSQASPHVAGIAVLAQQLAMQRLGRFLTPTQFINLLQSTGASINDGDDENDNVTNTNANFRRVDVQAMGEAIWQMGGLTYPFGYKVALAADETYNAADFGDWKNTAPVAVPLNVSTQEDTPLTIQLVASDVDDDALTYSLTAQPQHGTWTRTGSQVLYMPAANYYGTDTFTYVATDGTDASAPAIVTIEITPVNDLPAAVDDYAFLQEGVPSVTIQPLSNDTDADGDVLQIVSFEQGTFGTVTLEGDSLIYTPIGAFTGLDQFAYAIQDGAGVPVSGTVYIASSVGVLDGAWPTYGGTSMRGSYFAGFIGGARANEGWSLPTGTGNGRGVTIGGGRAFVSDQTGSTEYIRAYDATYGTPLWSMSLTGNDAVDQATYFNGILYAQFGNSGTSKLVAINATTGAVIWQAGYGAQWETHFAPAVSDSGNIWINGGTYGGMYGFKPDGTQIKFISLAQYDEWTPAIEGESVYSYVAGSFVKYTSAGNVVWTNTKTWNWGGWSMNRVPVLGEGKGFLIGNPDLYAVDLSTGTTLWTVAGTFIGSPAIAKGVVYALQGSAVKAFDAATGAPTATYTLPAAASGQPIVTDDALIVASSGSTYIISLKTGAILQTIAYGGQLSLADNRLFISSSDGSVRTYVVPEPANLPPVATPDDMTVIEDTATTFDLAANDTDANGDLVHVISLGTAAHGQLLLNADGTVRYTPSSNYNGADTFTYILSDEHGGLATGSVTVTVTAVNDAPVAAPRSATLPTAGGTISLSGSDAEGSALTFRVTKTPAHGTVMIDGSIATFTPTPGYTGSDIFEYVANDGELDGAAAQVTLVIDDAPVASPQSVTLNEDTPTAITLVGTDPNGNRLTYSVVTAPQHGSYSLSGNGLTYTPALNYSGTDTFTFRVFDEMLYSGNATVSLTIKPVNDAPVSKPDAFGTRAGGAVVTANVLANDTDVEGDPLTVTDFTQAVHGAVQDLGGGRFLYIADSDYVGRDSFTYTVNDGQGGAAIGTVTLHVGDPSLAGDWSTYGNGPAHAGYFAGMLLSGQATSLWSLTVGTQNIQQVAVGDGRIYLTPWTYFGDTFAAALDTATGSLLWKRTFASAYSINPPTYANGRVYFQRGNHSTDTHLWAVNPIDGTTIWSAAHAAQWERYGAPTVAAGGVFVNGGSYGGMYGFNESNGSQRFFVSKSQYAGWTPTYHNGKLYAAVGTTFAEHDPVSGATNWSISAGNGYAATIAADGNRAVFTMGGTLFCIDLVDRKELWTATGATGAPSIAKGIVYVAAGNNVVAYNADTGAVIQQYAADSAVNTQPIITDDAVIVAGLSASYIFDLSSGALRQKIAGGGYLSLADNVLYVAGTNGSISAYRLAGPTSLTSVPDLLASSDTGTSDLDNLTRITTPTFTGTAPAGVTVYLIVDGRAVGSGSADQNGNWTIISSAIPDGTHQVSAIADDLNGDSISAPLSITIKSGIAAPAAAPDLRSAKDTGISDSDNITGDLSPIFDIQLPASDRFRLYRDGVQISADYEQGTSYQVLNETQGVHAYRWRAVDLAGNESDLSAELTVTFDGLMPSQPSLTADSDSGLSDSDAITRYNNTSGAPLWFLISGLQSGGFVELLIDGSVCGSATANGNSLTIAVDPFVTLSDGTHVVSARQTIAASPTSNLATPLTVVIDTVAPSGTPTVGLSAVSDTGISSTDGLTNATAPSFDVASLAEYYRVLRDGVAVAGWQNADSWASALLVDGTYTFSVEAMDVAGNIGLSSSATVTIDSIAPAVPSALILQGSSDSGLSNSDGNTNDATPTFDVTATPYYRVYRGGVLISGNYEVGAAFTSGALADGALAFTIRAVDAAGNLSAISPATNVTIDTATPTVSAPSLQAASDSGVSSTDGLTNIVAPTFNVSGGPYFRMYRDGALVSGNYASGTTFTSVTLADGAYAFTLVAVDLAGNASAQSTMFSVTIDTIAPSAPSAPALQSASDSGISNTDSITNIATPTFNVSGSPFFRVYRDGSLVSLSYPSGTTFTSATLPSATYLFTLAAVDAAGNASAQSSSTSITVDTIAPTVPSAPALQAGSDSGISATDRITNVTTPIFNVAASPYFRVYRGGTLVSASYATGATFTSAPLADAAYSFTLTAVDAAGNASTQSPAASITIDTLAPAAPTGFQLDAASDSGVSSSDGITNDATPSFSIATTSGYVRVFRDGALASAAYVPAGGAGTWTQLASYHAVAESSTWIPSAAVNLSAYAGMNVQLRWVFNTLDSVANSFEGWYVDDIRAGNGTTTALLAEFTSGSDGFTIDNTGGGLWHPSTGRGSQAGHSATGSMYYGKGEGPSGGGNYNTGAANTGKLISPAFTVPSNATLSFNYVLQTENISSWDKATLEIYVAPATGLTLGNQVDGASVYTISSVDVAGNASSAALPTAVTIDTVAPSTPSAPDLQAASDSGASSTDNITKVTSPVFDVGSAPYFRFYRDGVLLSGNYATGSSYTAVAQTNGQHGYVVTAVDTAGNASLPSLALLVTIDIAVPSTPLIAINSGATQRSMVNKIAITFSEPVTLTQDALKVVKNTGAAIPNVTVTPANPSGDLRTWELTFGGVGAVGGSLPDGTYKVVVSAARVSDLAGNHLTGDYSQRFHRLFGDSDGDRDVDAKDVSVFKQMLNRPANYVWWLDFNDSKKIDYADYLQLRARRIKPLLK